MFGSSSWRKTWAARFLVLGSLLFASACSSVVPVPTATSTLVVSTITPEATATSTPTAIPSPTSTPTATPVPVPTPTATPVPTPTPSPVPTALPTEIPTATPVPTPTATPVPTALPTATPTATPEPTSTPVPTPTRTPLPPLPRVSSLEDLLVQIDEHNCFRFTNDIGGDSAFLIAHDDPSASVTFDSGGLVDGAYWKLVKPLQSTAFRFTNLTYAPNRYMWVGDQFAGMSPPGAGTSGTYWSLTDLGNSEFLMTGSGPPRYDALIGVPGGGRPFLGESSSGGSIPNPISGVAPISFAGL